MSIRTLVSSISPRRSVLSFAVLAATVPCALGQTAPQLLPYTAKLIAGGGTSNPAKGAACPVSGYIALDAFGDGCLATEILLGTSPTVPGPRDAVADAAGNIFFSDYPNALIRRVDAITGIVTAVAGGGTTSAGTATAALGTAVKLSHPASLAFVTPYGTPANATTGAPASTATGDLYFSDPGNGQIFKIASTGGVVGGSVGQVAITSGGSGYTSAPTVTFSAPTTGTAATGTAVLTGSVVTSVTVTNPGSGYTAAPTVTFSAPTTGATATGTAGMTGVITLVAGSPAGTYGYGASNATTTVTEAAGNSYLRAVYGLVFDAKGDLFFVDEYTEAILVLNTNATGSNTVNNVTVPAGQIWKVAGTSTGATAPYCVNGTASGYGCNYALYTENAQANADSFDSTYSVAVDSNGVLYGGNEYYNSVFQVSPAGILSTFTGKQGTGESYAYQKAALPRATAGSTFVIGSIFGLVADPASNLYISDASNGVIWRVDSAGKSQYAVAGGVGDIGSPATVCSTATDTLGDGCPALQATLGHSGSANYASTTLPGPGIYGISVDANANLFLADTQNNDVREIASGTQFGPIGANQPTQTVEIHFASGDLPATSSAAILNPASTNFSLGALTLVAHNSDGTSDYTLPITATPTALGPFSANLQVTSVAGAVGNFALSGTYIQSPVTLTSLTYAAGVTCAGTTTYATTTTVTLKATIVANGPTPPTTAADTVTFYANGVAIGSPVQVTNIGTTASPVYGATLATTFATPATYTLTAVFSGDTYFKPSTGKAASTVTTSLPGFTLAPVAYQQATVAAGQTALYSFTVAQNVYSGVISFAVTGLPANTTYAITPTNITATGCSTVSTVALSIITQQQTVVKPAGFISSGRWQLFSIAAGLGLALLVGIRRRRLPLRYGQLMLALALLLTAVGATGCGKAVGTVIQPRTPASPANQPYQIIVTPSATVGTPPAPITFSLTVL